MNKKVFLTWMKAGHLSIPKLLLKNYTKLGLNETEMMTLLQVYLFMEEGHLFPTPNELSEHVTSTPGECANILRKLLKGGYLHLQELVDEQGVLSESYTFDPLWERLMMLLHEEEDKSEQEKIKAMEENIYTIFEREFSRPLSPMECELLTIWIDQEKYSEQLIKAALRESVVSGKLSFRYIDRILFEWKKNGVKTVEQARAYGEKFRQTKQRTRKTETEQTNGNPPFPTYNWLET